MDIIALASDYDGTIADDGVTQASTIASLARFKDAGGRLILVTGRPLNELHGVFNRLDLFERVVGENGGLLYDPATGETRLLAAPPSAPFVARLRERGVDELTVSQTVVATHTGHFETIRSVIDEMGFDLDIILNTDALMVLPPGVNKASGLAAALGELTLSAAQVAAIGDAENDVAFLTQCGFSVAVANALPEVKAIADMVTRGSRGAGVEEFLDILMQEMKRSR